MEGIERMRRKKEKGLGEVQGWNRREHRWRG
jgi:hypothetical protein